MSGFISFSRDERFAFLKKDNRYAMLIFAILMTCYICVIFVMLVADWCMLLILAPICGLLIAMLFVVGHDACHHSLTNSRWLNHLIGRIAFLPSLHPFSLWDLAHNRTHHKYNNIRKMDYVWEPLTLEEFAEASRMKRFAYRIYRHPLGVPLYYVAEIWLKKIIWPWPSVIERSRPIHFMDSLLVWLFLGLQCGICWWMARVSGKPALPCLVGVVVLPFLIWNGLMSMAIFLHHMHPQIRWYGSIEEWRRDQGMLKGTVHVRFPWLVRKLLLNIMEHPAHHLLPSVPLYRVETLQAEIERRTDVVTWTWSWQRFVGICRRCKLFDYRAGRWTGFDGEPVV